jgi:FkbM family methyltransferase
MKTIVQVGANKGATDNDPVWALCQKNLPESLEWELLLFEPNPKAAHICRENYKRYGFKHVTIIEAAVSDCDRTVELYIDNDIPGNEGSQHASMYLSHMYKMGHRDEALVKISVPCVTLNDYIPHEVDYLQIDTEGHDDIIVNSIDFDRFDIKMIEFERAHIGQQRLDRTSKLLLQNGYRLLWTSNEDVCFGKT